MFTICPCVNAFTNKQTNIQNKVKQEHLGTWVHYMIMFALRCWIFCCCENWQLVADLLWPMVKKSASAGAKKWRQRSTTYQQASTWFRGWLLGWPRPSPAATGFPPQCPGSGPAFVFLAQHLNQIVASIFFGFFPVFKCPTVMPEGLAKIVSPNIRWFKLQHIQGPTIFIS